MKKKIKLMLFLLLGIMILPMVAKADMGAPEIKPYDLTVTNEAGISLYDSDYTVIDTIPKGTVITISYEYKEDGIIYGSIYGDGYSGIVKLSDFTASDSVIAPNVENGDIHFSETRKAFIIGSDIYLHSGPANGYKVVTKAIPSSTILEYNNTDENGAWAYTEYDGVKGWLEVEAGNPELALSCSAWDAAENGCTQEEIMTLDKIYLYDFPSDSAKIVSKEAIPSLTNLTYEFDYSEPTGIHPESWAYLTYNGLSGWTRTDFSPIAFSYNSELLTYKEIKLYTSPLNGGKESTKTVVANTKLEVSYYYYNLADSSEYTEWYYVKYKNDYYWIGNTQNFVFAIEDDEEEYTQEIKNKNTYLYSLPDLNSEKVIEEAIPTKSEVDIEYNGFYDNENKGTWFYIIYNDNEGWILAKDNDELFIDENFVKELAEAYDKALKAVEKAEKSKNIDDVNAAYVLVNKLRIGSDKMLLLERLSTIKIEKEIDKPVVKEDKLSPKEIIYYSVGGAVVLALVNFVTIKLINKKRKANIIDLIKKEEPKEPEVIKAEEIAVIDNKKDKKKAKK